MNDNTLWLAFIADKDPKEVREFERYMTKGMDLTTYPLLPTTNLQVFWQAFELSESFTVSRPN